MASEHGIITSFELQRQFGAVIDRVRGGETLVVTSHKRAIYALVPIDTYNELVGEPVASGRFDDEPMFAPAAVR
jgi:prevent-host-death family protein